MEVHLHLAGIYWINDHRFREHVGPLDIEHKWSNLHEVHFRLGYQDQRCLVRTAIVMQGAQLYNYFCCKFNVVFDISIVVTKIGLLSKDFDDQFPYKNSLNVCLLLGLFRKSDVLSTNCCDFFMGNCYKNWVTF